MKGLLAIKVKENDVIVDIGAHFGLFTLESFALSNHTSKHYCFEPIPQIRAKLEDTVSGLTAAGSDQIKVFPFGLGKEDASFQFTYVNLPSLPPLFFISLCLSLSPHYLRVLVGSRTMMGVSATSLIITMGTAPPPLPSFESVASYICQPLCIHFLYIYIKKISFINAPFFFPSFSLGL